MLNFLETTGTPYVIICISTEMIVMRKIIRKKSKYYTSSLITLLHLSYIVNNLEIQAIRIGSIYYRAFAFKNVQKINLQATAEKKQYDHIIHYIINCNDNGNLSF